ncbi:MAG: hypothetical protein ACAH82_01635 [Solirubrobacteraceae bacterium]
MGRLTERLNLMRERREQRLATKPERAQKARAEALRREHQREDHSHTGRR